VTALTAITKEKGLSRGNSWPKDTLFGMIDAGIRQGTTPSPFERFPRLICDDQAMEWADFIGWDASDPRIVLVHAKCSDSPRPLSVSALGAVCASVVKGLGFLQYGPQDVPILTQRWSRAWSLGSVVKKKRIRFGAASPADAATEVIAVMRNPESRREAWIVLGIILSKSRLSTETVVGPKNPSASQICHLISQTKQACDAMGFRLRIFCMP
jgi:hypothetical protein